MKNELFFDLRKSPKAKLFRSAEWGRVRNDVIFLIFTSFLIVTTSVAWAIKPGHSFVDIALLGFIVFIALISLLWALYLRPKAWYEKRITFPLIDKDSIFKEDSFGNVIEQYPLTKILAIYSSPSYHFITLLLTEKSKKGFMITDIAKDQILDVDLFISILEKNGVCIIKDNINADIMRNHLTKYKHDI